MLIQKDFFPGDTIRENRNVINKKLNAIFYQENYKLIEYILFLKICTYLSIEHRN